MKKYLLVGLSIGICVGAIAQTMRVEKMNTSQNYLDKNNPIVSSFHHAAGNPKQNTTHNGSRAITKKMFTSSWNVFGTVVTETNALNANQATNTIAFTHRASKDWPAVLNNGYIQVTFTTDNGATWDSLLLNEDQANFSRYPSGTLFNPAGNTASSGLFALASGPITDNTNWTGNYFASRQLDGSNDDVITNLNATSDPAQHFVRTHMQSTDSKVIVTGALLSNPNANFTSTFDDYRGVSINYGTLAANKFTWQIDSIIPATLIDANSQKEIGRSATTAWSQDGAIGYTVFTGIKAGATGDQQTYQPIVYKTIDGGTNWNIVSNSVNFSTIPAVVPTLFPSSGGTFKAFYWSGDGFGTSVDVNGNLHIVCAVRSSSSDNTDSLGFASVRGNTTFIYDTYTTSTGWDAMLIDSIKTKNAKDLSPFIDATDNKPVEIDSRIQVSISADRKKVFYMWIDTSDPNLANGENAFPDIKGKGYDVNTKGITATKTFTNDGRNYFMFASPTALVNGTTYSVPCTVTDRRGGDGNSLTTFDHYYVSGVEFEEAEFIVTGINEISSNDKISISQNYPNPFSKETSVVVTLKENTKVSLDVFNTIGQKVITQNQQELSIGTHTLKIDGTTLTPGIYFYTVKAGNSSISRKMIVK